MAINSIQLPDNTTQDIHDARLSSISELSIDSTPTANSNNLVKSGGVKAYVDGAIPTVPVQDVTVGGTSVVSGGTAAIPAIPTVPTISTNIYNDKTNNTKTASPAAVYNEVHPAVVTSRPTEGFYCNTVYDIGTLTGDITFSLSQASPYNNSVANPYYWTFDTDTTAPTITWPSNIVWISGEAPTINASKHYEIMIRNGYATYLESEILVISNPSLPGH